MHGIYVTFQVVFSHDFLTHLTDHHLVSIAGHDRGLPTNPAFSRVGDITIFHLRDV